MVAGDGGEDMCLYVWALHSLIIALRTQKIKHWLVMENGKLMEKNTFAFTFCAFLILEILEQHGLNLYLI